ncbi:MAG: argininosuccinate synthase [Chloroflexota bacterium]|nr:argininosuccinate synthase [Chloroflexota bacterium]
MAPVRLNPALSLSDESAPKKVALAYSGGLDSSCSIPWLKERYDCEVVAVAADVGQPGDLRGVEAKALASGASTCYVLDLRDEFLTEYVYPTVRAGAAHERSYLLGTAMARPLIAKHQVEIALREGCDALAHGGAGTGNDQDRFEPTYQALAPMLRVIAPARRWDIRSREDAIAYAEAHGIPVTATTARMYSIDGDPWPLCHDGSPREDSWQEPPAAAHGLTVALEPAARVTMTFERGTPVMIDGQRLDAVDLAGVLNKLGGAHGVGRVDPWQNRLVAMKSSGVYESPGGALLTTAHRELEHRTLDKATMRLKDLLAHIYADVVYTGHWYSPLREALDAFVTKTQEPVTGEVRLKLDQGACHAVGRRSPIGRYDEDLAPFGAGDVYQRADSEGFIRLFGLGQNVAAWRDCRLQEQDVEMLR